MAAAGTDMELPILLAAFGPMRRGEICCLQSENISGNIVHVCANMVLDQNRNWILKSPKSYAGDRYIDYPDFVAQKWKGIKGPITNLHPNNITDRFQDCLKKAGLPHFRFHDLRIIRPVSSTLLEFLTAILCSAAAGETMEP